MISGLSFRLFGQCMLCLISIINTPVEATQETGRQENKALANNKSAARPATVSSSSILPASQFKYPIRLGYRAAKSAQDTIRQLFCYCGCDGDHNQHTNLRDCFTSIHGAYCPICQEEAIMASSLKNKGLVLTKIQSDIDCSFAKRYPYKTPSRTLNRYRLSLSRQGVKLGELSTMPKKINPAQNSTGSSCCSK